MDSFILLIMCHLMGDYVLQGDFVAKTKGTNWYHMIVHCVLYVFPFYLFFGICWQLAAIFIAHVIIDPLKARYNKISYMQDQLLHYVFLLVYLI